MAGIFDYLPKELKLLPDRGSTGGGLANLPAPRDTARASDFIAFNNKQDRPDFGFDNSVLDNAGDFASSTIYNLFGNDTSNYGRAFGEGDFGIPPLGSYDAANDPVNQAFRAGQQRLQGLLFPKPAGSSDAVKVDVNNPLVSVAVLAANQYGIDPNVFARLIAKESGYNPGAVSPKGARGVAQFMPDTGNYAAQLIGVSPQEFWQSPELQIKGAAALMAQYVTKYGGNYAMALAAYNAGEGNVDAARGVPDIPETQKYVQDILGNPFTGPTGGAVGRVAPVTAGQYAVSFGYNQRYDTPITGAGGRIIPTHEGVDLVRPDLPDNGRGAPITAFHPGRVQNVGQDNNGKFVIVLGNDGYLHVYVHMDDVYVQPGQQVDQTTAIGSLGSSGAEAPHLHFAVRLPDGTHVDPTPWLR